MLEEALEAPAAVARQLAAGDEAVSSVGERWRAQPPQRTFTLARGSSDHAAHFTAYLLMSRLGCAVTSLPPSLVTLEHAPLERNRAAVLAFSQSGRSPDLVEAMRWFSGGGTDTVAIVNDPTSPLAEAAGRVIDIHAGTERCVAATKSFITQLVAGARLVAAWQADAAFANAMRGLPDALAEAVRADWSQAVETLTAARRLLVIGRGPGLAIAQEAALKLKEVADLHAEAFSGAEVMHGPLALVHDGQPVLVFAPRGPAQAGLFALAQALAHRGAHVLLAAPQGTPGATLPIVEAPTPALDALCAIQSFYVLAEAVARARGLDPDSPRHLAKVTLTH